MTIERLTDEDVIRFAREFCIGEQMVLDPTDADWRMSSALLMSALSEEDCQTVGLILVPRSAHMAQPWLNERVPGCVVQMVLIHADDVDRLKAKADEMLAVLFPGEGVTIEAIRMGDDDACPDDPDGQHHIGCGCEGAPS